MATGLSELEKRALDLIRSEKGILQSILWKRLGLDSREGSRLVLRLVRKGLVKREQVSIDGRRTYKLYPVEARGKDQGLLVSLDLVLDIPCMTCPHFRECGNHEFYTPANCSRLEEWLSRLVARRRSRQRQERL